MPDTNLVANVTIAIKARISLNGNVWKDDILVRQSFGREIETRTVQGGDHDAIPGAKVGSGQIETNFSSDLVESVWPPVNPNTLAFWIYNIFELGILPIVTIERRSETKTGVQPTLIYTAWVTDIQPNDKGADNGEKCIITFTPKNITSFKI